MVCFKVFNTLREAILLENHSKRRNYCTCKYMINDEWLCYELEFTFTDNSNCNHRYNSCKQQIKGGCSYHWNSFSSSRQWFHLWCLIHCYSLCWRGILIPDLVDAQNLKEEMNQLPLMRLDSAHWDCDLQHQSPGQNSTKLVMLLCPKLTNTLTARC